MVMVGELGLRESLGQCIGRHLSCWTVFELYCSLLSVVMDVCDLDAVVLHASMVQWCC